MRPFILLLGAFGASAACAQDTIAIYQLTGERQCVRDDGVPVERAADFLRGQGVKVLVAERRDLPIEVGDYCGAPTAAANVMTVAAADWAAFKNKNPDAAGYGVWIFEDPTVEVFMYDGALQCGLGDKIPLQQMADALTTQGIEVIEQRKGNDGLAHIAVCGASTGAVGIFRIDRKDLDAARELGFRLMVSREMTDRVKRPMKRIGADQADAASEQTPHSPTPLLW